MLINGANNPALAQFEDNRILDPKRPARTEHKNKMPNERNLR